MQFEVSRNLFWAWMFIRITSHGLNDLGLDSFRFYGNLFYFYWQILELKNDFEWIKKQVKNCLGNCKYFTIHLRRPAIGWTLREENRENVLSRWRHADYSWKKSTSWKNYGTRSFLRFRVDFYLNIYAALADKSLGKNITQEFIEKFQFHLRFLFSSVNQVVW